MTIRQKQADIGKVSILKKQDKHKSKPNITFTKNKKKILKYKINGNHPAKKRKEEKRNIESTGKQGLNANKYVSINNHLKCQWTKCSNQTTQNGRMDKKAKTYSLLSKKDPPLGKGHK